MCLIHKHSDIFKGIESHLVEFVKGLQMILLESSYSLPGIQIQWDPGGC